MRGGGGAIDSASHGSDSSKPFLHCEDLCEMNPNAIYCDHCEYWIHWACEGLSDNLYEEFGKDMTEYKCIHCTAVDPENDFYGDTQNGEPSLSDISYSKYTTHSQAEACSGFDSSSLIESQSPKGLQDSCKGDQHENINSKSPKWRIAWGTCIVRTRFSSG